ncbi:protein of unknown function [Candidatus Promineifilum breve]|uniref:Uncharacterized protein n=1 Tax=Candidatus Promineifilum breve TaxID=1806508 RepID=A0A170PJG6_9CHLR|nr:protein of unknown function [Candidatus Promineifilum breve]
MRERYDLQFPVANDAPIGVWFQEFIIYLLAMKIDLLT